jgi:trehalose 6-phosphate synthase/phosphatase
MNILSYRGPSTAGGVSSALARIIETCVDSDPRWWYISESSVETRTSAYAAPEELCKIPKEVIDGHYAYCNSFIWPVLHDLPQHATLNMVDRQFYQQFNTRFARNIMRSRQLVSKKCFVNDYQLALATGLIAKSQSMHIILFWHVPWPSMVTPAHAPYLAEIAQGLLGAKRIGFHTEEYATNFLRFVETYLPAYKVDSGSRSIANPKNPGQATELVALPLGLDYRFWLETTAESTPIHKDLDVRAQIPGRFVLSVDRADYTKGVFERMEAIDQYFTLNPHRIGKITFVQVCQPTRIGLPAFDAYWQKCRDKSHELNARWQQGSWQPVSWIDKPVPPKVLAWLYSKAEAMLINPVRDGLNLTAKEFAVCSTNGALILSRGAGVWHEIGENVVALQNLSANEMATQIEASLTMPQVEKQLRLKQMKKTISANSLRVWWQNFEMGTTSGQNVVPISSRARKRGSGNKDLMLAK